MNRLRDKEQQHYSQSVHFTPENQRMCLTMSINLS